MNPPVHRLGLVLKREDPSVPRIVSGIIPWLQERGVEIFIDQDSVGEPVHVSATVVPPEELPGLVDAVSVFGGDGTFLYAARMVAARGVPILGINLGSLGFLTEVKLERMREAFKSLLAGDYQFEDRMLLDVEVIKNGSPFARYSALNDAVINKGALARIIELEVSVDSQLVTMTRADGIIISTPTGSTGYSLSAGGPILHPTLEALIITPICPHTLTNRPVVVPDSAVVGVCLRHGHDVMLTVDGQVGMPLEQGDSLRIGKADHSMRLIQMEASPFFKLLREKLKWG
ncbi:MAG: putative inorganic polyphosphate/ATP-NAD kinase ((P)/ATP kinase)(ppnK) [Acidobacteria bacterium]|jgi:NAD+ kinase|nr:putative inorganic polyphosphate/ATP-NAD kinase ((P)/ATP kinase)(ppnK) [Acidobacteriota bacterium]